MMQIIEDHYKNNFNTLVKRIAFRCGNNYHDAEDVVQEAYLRAIKYKETFDMGLPFKLWFSRILSNSLKDFKREQKAMGTMEEIREEHFEPLEDPSTSDAIRRLLRKEVANLPAANREVVELHLFYGYSNSEIVQVTDMKYKEVDNVIQWFKRSFRERHQEV